MMLKKARTCTLFLSLFMILSLSGCGKPDRQDIPDSGSGKESVNSVDAGAPSGSLAGSPDINAIADSKGGNSHYEYYLTEEEVVADIEQGYIFRLNTEFTKGYAPFVTQGDWPFYVHEDNTVSLEVGFANLMLKPKENIFPMGEQVVVEVISPDEETVYRFEKTGEEITKNTSLQEQISVTEGEWTLRISFGYYCGNTPAYLKIAAAYESPTEKDIEWLKEERLAVKENALIGRN